MRKLFLDCDMVVDQSVGVAYKIEFTFNILA